jgi:hypothetical protein
MRFAVLLALAVACTSRPPSTADEVRRIAADVVPRVEEAVGLKFRAPPVFGVRSHAELERYLIARLDQEYPPERLANMVAAYRRFGLVPDTLDLRALFLAVLKEQVLLLLRSRLRHPVRGRAVGSLAIRLVLAHELVHALQAQYLPLDSISPAMRRATPPGRAGRAGGAGTPFVAARPTRGGAAPSTGHLLGRDAGAGAGAVRQHAGLRLRPAGGA